MAERYLPAMKGHWLELAHHPDRQKGDDVGMPIPLMLATLTDRRDFGDDWLLERKFDGERCVATKHGAGVRLESRTGKNLTGTYPEVRAALAAQRVQDLVLDGEVVAVRRRSDVVRPASAAPRRHESHARARGRVSGRLLRLRHPRGRRRGSRR